VDQPTAALDLHYILSFYGEEKDLEPQRVLGSVTRTLHAKPLITRHAIRDTLLSSSFPYLVDSNLAEQPEVVRLSPISLNLEELSKLWSVFFQTAYRLSIAYAARVVLIEAEKRPERALPVTARNVYAQPFKQPVIEGLTIPEGDEQPITSTSTLIIEGQRLFGEITEVSIGDAVYTPTRAGLSERRITIDFNALTPTTGQLRAGLQGVQVIQQLPMGTPPVPHVGVESDVAPLVLRPTINTTGTGTHDYDIQISAPVMPPDAPTFRTITVHVTPDVGKDQRATLILNEYNVTSGNAYSFRAASRSTDGDTLTFTVLEGEVSAGDYLVQVQVDGATTPLVRDMIDTSPTYRLYIAPRVIMP
jgi:hypothetical protein